jgi:hypothetical protein
MHTDVVIMIFHNCYLFVEILFAVWSNKFFKNQHSFAAIHSGAQFLHASFYSPSLSVTSCTQQL